MSTHILVLNCGSSSLKFALIDPQDGQRLLSGLAENLGAEGARLRVDGEDGEQALSPGDHRTALFALLRLLDESGHRDKIQAVGHRVVHGGEQFTAPMRIDDSLLAAVQGVSHLAPLHNPLNLLGIELAMEAFDQLPHVAVFDTAFHQTIPAQAHRYAVPQSWYESHGVRRYGFHGTSHRYVTEQAAQLLNRPVTDTCVLTAHLGNGCSATAVEQGRSVDTTMGMTPLSGLVMGTRSGDIDPGVALYMAQRLDGGVKEVDQTLNRKSGLLGVSGSTNDMRQLLSQEQQGDKNAALAVDMFCYRLAASLAALRVAISRLDALVFTGGIGEHAAPIRSRVVERLSCLGLTLDSSANASHGKSQSGRIDALGEAAGPRVLVIPTDEEFAIAQSTWALHH